MTPPSRRLRFALGAVALLSLVVLLAWAVDGGKHSWPAVLEAGRTFRLSEPAGGRYITTLESGQAAAGAGILEQRSLTFERNDLLSLTLAPTLRAGQKVARGEQLGTLRSSLLEQTARSLQAERDLIQAQRDLLVAGSRPEEIAAARKALDVARALARGADPEVARQRALLTAGATGDAALQDAELNARVRALEAALAEAQVAEKSAKARPEELRALDAELSGIDARMAENSALRAEGEIRAPFDGEVSTGSHLEPDGTMSVLRVYTMDPIYARFPVPHHGDLQVGQTVGFQLGNVPGLTFQGTIAEISSEAAPLGGETVIWVTAGLKNPDGLLRPGLGGHVTLEGSPPP